MSENGGTSEFPFCRYCGERSPGGEDTVALYWHSERCAVRQIGYDPQIEVMAHMTQRIQQQEERLQEVARAIGLLIEVAQSLMNYALGNPVEPRPELLAALDIKQSRPIVVVPGIKFN